MTATNMMRTVLKEKEKEKEKKPWLPIQCNNNDNIVAMCISNLFSISKCAAFISVWIWPPGVNLGSRGCQSVSCA